MKRPAAFLFALWLMLAPVMGARIQFESEIRHPTVDRIAKARGIDVSFQHGGASVSAAGFYVTGLTTSFSGTVTSGSGTFGVCLSAPPTVIGGVPTLVLNTTPTAGVATFASVSGNCLVFNYTISVNQTANPVATSSAAVVLNGASVTNGSRTANLTGANGWTFAGVAFGPSGTPASVVSVVMSPATGLLTQAGGSNTATATITLNASVTASGSNVLNLSDGIACPIAAGSGTTLTASCTFTAGSDTPIAAANTYLGTAASSAISGGTISNGAGAASLANANGVLFTGLSVDTTTPLFAATTGSGSTCSKASPCSLAGAQTRAQGASGKHIWVRGGTYSTAANCSQTVTVNFNPTAISYSYCFSASDNNEAWLRYPGEVATLDGGSTAYGNGVAGALTLNGTTGFTINGLIFQNYGLNAISAYSQNGVSIWNTVEQNIPSTANSIGACFEFGNFWSDIVYSHNTCQNVGSFGTSGNTEATSTSGFNFKITYDSNIVLNTCENTGDCGGLYPIWAPTGFQQALTGCCSITNNIVGSTETTDGNNIYLDDYASNMTITGNLLFGSSRDCYFIHGGANNVFRNNVCETTNMSAYMMVLQDSAGIDLGGVQYPNPYGVAPGNVVSGNIIYNGNSSPPATLYAYWRFSNPALDYYTISGNEYYTTGGSFGSFCQDSGSGCDTSPLLANPGFVNPTLKTGAGFQTTGPVPSGWVQLHTDQGPH